MMMLLLLLLLLLLLALRRYISEDFGGVALHPVDIIDAASGRLLQQLTDLNLNTITPVNLPHPRLDLIISGSSRSVWAVLLPPHDAAAMCWVQLLTAHATVVSRYVQVVRSCQLCQHVSSDLPSMHHPHCDKH
jgi:hypothetical protein